MSTNLVGRKLGAYLITGELGQGGMANVYRAQQPSIGREVAIKVLPAHFLQDPTFVKRFEREVQVIAKLQNPHILQVYDFGEQDNMPYIVMALMTGGTLSDYLGEHPGGLPLEEVSRLVDQIADGMDYAHGKGVIHRDFKPGNVLMDERHNVYLADFGIAKVAESASQLTGSGIIGTPAYMAPEMTTTGEVSPLVDIYALGVTLFEMLAGKHPYPTQTPVGMLMAHASQPIPQVASQRPDLPAGVQGIIDRAMAKEPAQRYQSAGALAADLRAVLHDDSPITEQLAPVPLDTVAVTVRPGATRPQPEKKPGPPAALIAAGVVVAALVLVGAGLLVAFQTGLIEVGPPPAAGFTPGPSGPAPFKTLSGHRDSVDGLAFSPDGKLLVSGGLDRKVIVWDAATGGKKQTIDAPDQVFSLAVAPDGKSVAAGGLSGSLSFWDIASGSQLFKQDFLPAGQVSAAFSPDGATYAVATRDVSIALFDARAFKWLRAVDYPGPVWSLAYSPDGKTLAAGMGDGSAILHDAATDKELGRLSGSGGGVVSLAFSADGKWLAAATRGQLTVWDVAAAKSAGSLARPDGSLSGPAWLPDGRSLLLGSEDGRLTRLDPAQGSVLKSFGGGGAVTGLAVSPDGTLVAAGLVDGTIALWKVE